MKIQGLSSCATGRRWVRAAQLLASLALTCISATPALAELPVHRPVAGGVAVVPLPIASEEAPRARFGERPVHVARRNARWVALVGLPCDILPGNYILSLPDMEPEQSSVEFGVLPQDPGIRSAAGEDSTPQPSRIALPLPPGIAIDGVVNPAMARSIAYDAALVGDVTPDFEFSAPVESRVHLGYGRLAAREAPDCHDYLGFFTAFGSRVYAPAAGVVVAIPGGADGAETLLIAHGGEVLSVLGNLGEVLVEAGTLLDQGEVVGTAGSAEAPTGGRVDWAVSMNGYRVDPLRLAAAP